MKQSIVVTDEDLVRELGYSGEDLRALHARADAFDRGEMPDDLREVRDIKSAA